MPQESVANNLYLEAIPEELKQLNSLEEQIIAKHIPFMKAVALSKGGQNGCHGPVVCVPSNSTQMTNILPRNDDVMIRIKLKRKLTYKGHYEYQYVKTDHVLKALHYLVEQHLCYADTEICTDWKNPLSKTTMTLKRLMSKQLQIMTVMTKQIRMMSTNLKAPPVLGLLSALCGWIACSGVPYEARRIGLVRCHPASSPGRLPAPTDCCQSGGRCTPSHRCPDDVRSPVGHSAATHRRRSAVYPSPEKLQPTRFTSLPPLRWLCGFLARITYSWTTSLTILHHVDF
ncbi:hypothetical protein N1851_022984 [Merluccius polli]|uniref:DUF6570 domain-containing protein n=1 Tax=Merluccius polli TaxID=89951 RepID=A0AA47MGW6_MERPO|nr:hypothetical protein N1851_022984 [Merluccius polli]